MDLNTEAHYDIEETDFYKTLFSQEPQEACSLKVDLDCNTEEILFERLIEIFHQGTIHFYGDENNKVNLKNLAVADFEHLNKYFNSFGMQVCYKINHISQVKNLEEFINGKQNIIKEEADTDNPEKYPVSITVADLINYKNCRSSYLEDRKFNLQLDDEFYIIWFKTTAAFHLC